MHVHFNSSRKPLSNFPFRFFFFYLIFISSYSHKVTITVLGWILPSGGAALSVAGLQEQPPPPASSSSPLSWSVTSGRVYGTHSCCCRGETQHRRKISTDFTWVSLKQPHACLWQDTRLQRRWWDPSVLGWVEENQVEPPSPPGCLVPICVSQIVDNSL